MLPRAYIGYLVGYDSRNIFRIWILSRNQVIRIRDVTFDEKTFYTPSDINIGLLVPEVQLEEIADIL